MTRLFRALSAPALFALLLLSVSPASAQQSTITETIDNQIAAFRADDFSRAFEFASPMIRNMFGTPDRFGQMVRQGYPMVWRPAEVTYGTAEVDGPVTRQQVLITDQAGTLHTLEYEMIETETGWRINGVRMIRTPNVGV